MLNLINMLAYASSAQLCPQTHLNTFYPYPNSGASVTGLNNNAYQISRGEVLNSKRRLPDGCGFIKADFMTIPVEENTFDAVYEIEATCHAPDPVSDKGFRDSLSFLDHPSQREHH